MSLFSITSNSHHVQYVAAHNFAEAIDEWIREFDADEADIVSISFIASSILVAHAKGLLSNVD